MISKNIKSNKTTTILLTSAGGLTGVFLSKHFNKTGNYRIVGIDMSDINPLKKWVDIFYKVPSVTDEMFLPRIKQIIQKESIDILIPVTSYDVDTFSKIETQNNLKGVKMLLMDYEDHNVLSDKESCYKYLDKMGISTPAIYSSIEEIKYPCIIKPKKGSGSKNAFILNDETDYIYWSSKIEDSIVIQYLEGSEYTVDCLFDKNGKCVGANVRERLKTTGGGATVTRNNRTIQIDCIIKKLEDTGKVKGPVNFQFKILPNNELGVFDFNTRFASGGLPLTIESGFDIPNILIKILLDEKIEKWKPRSENNGLTMIRYYNEYFVNAYE